MLRYTVIWKYFSGRLFCFLFLMRLLLAKKRKKTRKWINYGFFYPRATPFLDWCEPIFFFSVLDFFTFLFLRQNTKVPSTAELGSTHGSTDEDDRINLWHPLGGEEHYETTTTLAFRRGRKRGECDTETILSCYQKKRGTCKVDERSCLQPVCMSIIRQGDSPASSKKGGDNACQELPQSHSLGGGHFRRHLVCVYNRAR